MKIPKKIKVIGRELEIEWDKELIAREDVKGQASFRYQTLKIQPSTSSYPRKQEDIEITFLHEILHFIFFYIEAERDCGKEYEKLVTRLAEVLYQVLKDNKLDFSK